MEKNQFLLYNDVIASLYSCESAKALQTRFLPRIKHLVFYSYASIFLWDPLLGNGFGKQIPLTDPYCVPESFAEAEKAWVHYRNEDDMLWLKDGAESMLVRESDFFDDETRLNSDLYKHCYRKFDVFDTMEFAILDNGQPLGFITLFRTSKDPRFSDEEMFIMQSLGRHLRTVFRRIVFPDQYKESELLLYKESLVQRYGLTFREMEILDMMLHFKDNRQIAESLGIRDNTLQKHYYNIFRKLNVSSRWDAAAWYYKGKWKRDLLTLK